MKKIILSLLTVLMFFGCVYDKATLEYAQKNNLSKDFYSDVEIACIVKSENKFDDKKLNNIILNKIRTQIKNKYESNYMQKCDGYLRLIEANQIYQFRRDSRRYNQILYQKYNMCKSNYNNSIRIYNSKSNKNGKKIINFSYKIDRLGNANLGYLGIDEKEGKVIYFYRNANTRDINIGNILKNYPECKNNIFK